MIDYAILCQTIADWQAGRRPSVILPSSTPTLPQPMVAAPLATDDEPSTELSAEDYDDDAQAYGVPTYDAGPGGTPREAIPVEGGWSTPPADVDSTMVYGTGGAMPGGAWDGGGEAHEGEVPAYGEAAAGDDDAYETEIDADVETDGELGPDGEPRERS
ncbi:MAG: hypothetical protein IPH07_05615 [Deltaproteobacteria bacterium]|nr:hypothetical protein [Deltaproteobacteria bacterium]MBK8237528.1 hypothetical protein [Deltaproteobacteria bacterium]MBK8719879.1 hypothetical protein [Deltaproteobacteria bacterium]MBP7291776.1 hypothetical protein [Nannocystaceae bacterium]